MSPDAEIDPTSDMHPGPEVWHEAGHAVVARWQGGVVQWVTIESEEDDHQGHTEVLWSGFDERERARRSAMVSMAGVVAESLEADLDLADIEALSASRVDLAEAEVCLRVLSSDASERSRLAREMMREIARFLSEPSVRERLARVVDALHAHATLDETLFEDALG